VGEVADRGQRPTLAPGELHVGLPAERGEAIAEELDDGAVGRGLAVGCDRILIHMSPDGASRYYTSMAPEDLPRMLAPFFDNDPEQVKPYLSHATCFAKLFTREQQLGPGACDEARLTQCSAHGRR
jgi:hypothetical protein